MRVCLQEIIVYRAEVVEFIVFALMACEICLVKQTHLMFLFIGELHQTEL